MNVKEFTVNGFRITIIQKSSFEVIGFSRFVRLDGASIGAFLQELTDSGQMDRLAETLAIPQQIWVCLSGNERRSDADCRCTVCVEKSGRHDFTKFNNEELFTLSISESEWADYEVGNGKSFTDLHHAGVYNMIGEIGYKFNNKVGLHFDNEYEESKLNQALHFLLPVIRAE
ncbi:MAG: GyrI-like domain-containing protein [Oscillospiraceae bacterium]|nr:GyrI-like domain-containing protein [Oscillospiraceae bacterium]